jgi:hypothetical protein
MARVPPKTEEFSALRILLTALVVVCIGMLVCSRTFYEQALIDSFFALALGSAAILHFRVFPKWRDAAIVTASTLVMAFVCFRVLHFPRALMPWFSYIGLSSLAVMIIRSIWAKQCRLMLYAWMPAVLFVASDYSATTMLAWTSAAHPRTLDEYLLLFDASLRIQPAFIAGQLYRIHPLLHNASLIAYVGLAVPIMMVYAGQLARVGEKAVSTMVAFLITGPIGIFFYNLFPAAGPGSLFGHRFPFSPLPYEKLSRMILEPVLIGGARNGMPSLHLAWTLLAWWYSRKLSRIERVIAFLFLGLTAFATLGTGEHWFADLVAAFPFALMIHALSAYELPFRDAYRRAAFVFGLATTLTWLLLFRYCTRLFWTSPIVPWSLIAGTIALTTIRQGMLVRAEDAMADDTTATQTNVEDKANPQVRALGFSGEHDPDLNTVVREGTQLAEEVNR